MPHAKPRIAAVAAVATLVAANVMWVALFSANHVTDASQALGEAPPQRGGQDDASPQRARVDSFIQQVSGFRNFDEVVEGLLDHPGDPNATDIVFAAGFQTQDLNPQTHYLQVLADRRTSKLFEILSREPHGVACRKATEVFEQQLAAHRKLWEQRLVHRGGAPAEVAIRNRQGMPLQLRHTRHATCVALFLCACFCEPKDVIAKLDHWQDTMSGIASQFDAGDRWYRATLSDFNLDGRVQPLYRLNILCLVLDRQRAGLSQEVLDDLPNGMSRHFRLKEVPLCRWDAPTNPFDFGAYHRGDPVDDDDVLMQVRFRRGWGVFQQSPVAQEQILNYVTRVVAGL